MITADFRADLFAHIDAQLAQLGYDPSAARAAQATLAPYLMVLLRALRRIPAARPRRVIQAPDFAVPAAHEPGYQALLHAVTTGQSLRPWLSTLVDDPGKVDALLDDWGIHHFHLGATPHPTRVGYVARTEEVAFALVRPDAVYFLVTTSHNHRTAPLVWTQTELVEIMHRNWPGVIGTPRVPAHGQEVTPELRADFRKWRVNAGVTMADGTVYFPPGGGMMTAGNGMNDYIYQMQLLRHLEYLDAVIREREPQIRAMLGLGADDALALTARFAINFPEGFVVEVWDLARNVLVQF